jgi:hypothetical protein
MEMKEGEDFYFNESGLMVFTEKYHLKRGYCCTSGCKHCPYGFGINISLENKTDDSINTQPSIMKRAIVVGATSGIGKGLSKLLALNNYKVGIAGRRTELLLEMKKEYPKNFFLKTIDITDTIKVGEQLEELVLSLIHI